jgi:chromosome segregation ATPase
MVQEMDSLEASNVALQKEKERVCEELKRVTDELGAARRSEGYLKSQCNHLEQGLKRMEHDNCSSEKKLKDDISELRHENTRLQERIVALDRLVSEAGTKDAEIKQLRESNSELERSNIDLQDDTHLEALKQQIATRDEEITKLAEEITKLTRVGQQRTKEIESLKDDKQVL